MASSRRCRKGTRKCFNGRCMRKHHRPHFSKKLGRCRKGSRRCRDHKCHRVN